MARRPVERHSGARGNILAGPLWEENVCIFFLKWHILAYFTIISGQRRGPPNVAGPRVAYPLPHVLSRRA